MPESEDTQRFDGLPDAMVNLQPLPRQAAVIRAARLRGHYNHVIAAYFGFNQGRIAEVNTGKRWPDVEPANDLPADFPALAA